jgi:CTP synthase
LSLRILLIDDQPASVEPVEEELRAKVVGAQPKTVGFDTAQQMLQDFEPHVVVLDILKGHIAGEGEPIGLKTLDYVWTERFCPLVIYTAVPELVEDDLRKGHPFVKVVKKGRDSEQEVVSCIDRFAPHISALDEVGREIHAAMTKALKEVAPRIFESLTDPQQIDDMLTRSARRRVAAAMDDALSTGGPTLRSWEHYLCPPSSGHLLTGDIIRNRKGDPKDPLAYAVVLTPSCDLVHDEQREPKVSEALVACCKGADRVLQDLALDGWKNKHRDKLLPLLRAGYGPSCLPLASLPGKFPPMAADLRALKLIALGKIGNFEESECGEYVRIASVDSPFRELVSWVYMHVAARPGLPDRDWNSWAEEIIGTFHTTGSGN